MRLSAVLSVVFVLMAVTQAVTLSKHGGEAHHASSKHAAKKSKAKKAVSEKAPSAAKKSHKDAPGAAKKSHKKNRHTTTLVQAKQHEEDFGTTGGGGEEPQQAGPAPAARPAGPAPAARPAASGGGTAAAVWNGETNRYGPCLRDFASLVSNNECAKGLLGDVEYFLNTVDQEEHTLSAGYKTGMARKGMVIEGIGMNASSSEATPLTRHAFQRSRVELAYACAPAGSECKSYMTPVNEIDSSIGKDKECPTKLMQGGTDPAMRNRFVQIVYAYSTNSEAYFWGNSREYAAAVAVCFYVRTYGNGGTNSAPPGMLLKENIYSPAPAGIVVSLEEDPKEHEQGLAGPGGATLKHTSHNSLALGHGGLSKWALTVSQGLAGLKKVECASGALKMKCNKKFRDKVVATSLKVIKVTGGAALLVVSLAGIEVTAPLFVFGLAWNMAWLAKDLWDNRDAGWGGCGEGGVIVRAVLVNGVGVVTGIPVEEFTEGVATALGAAADVVGVLAKVESTEGWLSDIGDYKKKVCQKLNGGSCQWIPCRGGVPSLDLDTDEAKLMVCVEQQCADKTGDALTACKTQCEGDVSKINLGNPAPDGGKVHDLGVEEHKGFPHAGDFCPNVGTGEVPETICD